MSELVTNAVLHGLPAITLRIVTAPGTVRIEVHDQGSTVPAPAAPHLGAARAGGRGLLLVQAVASGWGVTRAADRAGKSVWCELHAHPVPNVGAGRSMSR